MTDLFVGEVTRTVRLTPGMVRVTFGGLHDFSTTGVGDEFVRIHFPAPDGTLHLPRVDEDGVWHYPEGVDPHVEPYTIRRHDAETGEVDIDFVVHEHGFASQWAVRARPGARVAWGAPRGLYTPPADARRQVFVTDATGLPALGRLLEQLPDAVDAVAIVEIADAAHRQELRRPSGPVAVRWIPGRGNGVAPSAMTEALDALDLDADAYVWVAGEAGALRDARRHLRHDRKLPADQYDVIGYWRHDNEGWLRRWEALDPAVVADLQSVWDDAGSDAEAARDEYESRLARLGL